MQGLRCEARAEDCARGQGTGVGEELGQEVAAAAAATVVGVHDGLLPSLLAPIHRYQRHMLLLLAVRQLTRGSD